MENWQLATLVIRKAKRKSERNAMNMTKKKKKGEFCNVKDAHKGT